ncbi:Mu-like prophage major head subunit gpT family protein [Limnoglobus roseus]|uniref:Bacteriophage Mu GpT domain-containing protein n=1 Tax=Limnoglobus roseus TaxID=2598579 RepID=A0A5C1AM91_9BACT|nr:Mu-like prophage major head subunit gpT family protein [Limnoglobus roseus]QEL18304.1 hypothetical protein PX52LOC_05325 [Limnoglobus roseus]
MSPDVFTSILNTELMVAKANAEAIGPAPVERFCQVIPSTTRVHNFLFDSVVGDMKEFKGHRTFQKFASDVYPIRNKRFDNTFEVNKDDVDDDQVGVYKLRPAQIVKKSRRFWQRLALRALRDGETGLAFDKQPFFSQTHGVGSVAASGVGAGEGDGNIMTFTAASGDAKSHRIVLVVNDGSTEIKPIIITERMPVTELMTDAGTPQAEMNLVYKYWVDARYGAGYGFWWDALLIKITNTPTQTELQSYLGKAEVRLRSFLIDKARAGDDSTALHEELNFNAESVTALFGTGLTNLMRTVLGADTIVQSGAPVTNMYKGWAFPQPTSYLN